MSLNVVPNECGMPLFCTHWRRSLENEAAKGEEHFLAFSGFSILLIE